MTQPTFGFTIESVPEEARPAIYSDMSVVGLVGTAPNADPSKFPLNVPVHMFSNDAAMQLSLGTGGTLLDAVQAVNDQLADFQVAARTVIVRVAADVDPDVELANVLGNEDVYSGIYGLLRAGVSLGVIPRLIGVPGYTVQHLVEPGTVLVTSGPKAGGNTGTGLLTLVAGDGSHGVGVQPGTYQVRCIGGAAAATSAAVAGGGNGTITMAAPSAVGNAKLGDWRLTCIATGVNGGTFQVEDPDGITRGVVAVGTPFNGDIKFTINDGSADFVLGSVFVVTAAPAVPAGGGVFSVRRPDATMGANATEGVAYTGQINFTIAAGGTEFIVGDGFDVVVAVTSGLADANVIVAALDGILNRLLGVAVVDGPSDSIETYQAWRQTISSKRIIPCAMAVKFGIYADIKPMSPRVLGQIVSVDFENAGRPFHSAANRPLANIVGPNRDVDFNLLDGATEGQVLLAANGGIVVRGEMGVENAIASGGFIYVGTDTCSEDPLWTFYHEVRGRDFIHLAYLRTLRYYLGRFNITGQAIQAVVNTMAFILRDLKADNDILGYRISFTKDENSPEELRLGHFMIDFAAEEPPVLRLIGIKSARYRPALDTLMTDLMAQVDLQAAA
jgi:hypothetical protein